jgi:conjugative relaxase-like TrwC/TraI family protein
MLTISKPLTARQALAYHSKEFTNSEQAYYTQGAQVQGEWTGRLADEWGLHGGVTDEQFGRLANGQHPISGDQIVRRRESYEYKNENGETVRTMEHRAGWDATFSAPKSVSLTALVGGDKRVQQAHRESVGIALNELERFVQARIGGNHPAATTGKWVAAKFEHDSARPVDGYAAPQLHTHVVFFNVTETDDGKTRAVQPQELYKSQKYSTAIYQAELGYRLRELGYDINTGKNGAPEIKGYTQEYLDASSPRSQQIKAHLEEHGLSGAGPAQIAAHRTRDAKSPLSADEMLERHRDLAARFGNQAQRVMDLAQARATSEGFIASEDRQKHAQEAVTYSRDRHIEREAVVGERELMSSALKRTMGESRFRDVQQNFEQRLGSGEFVAVNRECIEAPARTFTTREMLDYERDNLSLMKAGQGRFQPLVVTSNREVEQPPRLSNSQRQAVDEILGSRDHVVGFQGSAGAGKTTSLAAIRESAEREGYEVKGFAPTSRAAHQLEESGIRSDTLQHFLMRSHGNDLAPAYLYILDESSLASTRQVNDFLHLVRDDDRVILVGDTRQHQGVEAGVPFQQFQNAGMHTVRLDEIVRQKDPALKKVVEDLAHGDVRNAIEHLHEQGRIHEITDRQERIGIIAKTYADHAELTLVVSPDNRSRQDINEQVHNELKSRGKIDDREHQLTVLLPRQDLTGADRQWASQYELGDIVRYTRDSKSLGIHGGEYARVAGVERVQNLLTVQRANGAVLTYNPRRLHGVSVYKEGRRDFSSGERVQFTAPNREDRIANRELGTVEHIDSENNIQVRLDSGPAVQINGRRHLHLDYGYAVTSHSSQGLTADRVLLHVDTEQAHSQLINTRLAYVAVSRGRHDAQIYTNNARELTERLSNEVSKQSALDSGRDLENGKGAEQQHQGREREGQRVHKDESHQDRAQDRGLQV